MDSVPRKAHKNDDAFIFSACLAFFSLSSTILSCTAQVILADKGELTELKGIYLKIRSPPDQKSQKCLRAFAQLMAPVLFLKEPGEL